MDDVDGDLGPPPDILPNQFTYGEYPNMKKYTVFLQNGETAILVDTPNAIAIKEAKDSNNLIINNDGKFNLDGSQLEFKEYPVNEHGFKKSKRTKKSKATKKSNGKKKSKATKKSKRTKKSKGIKTKKSN